MIIDDQNRINLKTKYFMKKLVVLSIFALLFSMHVQAQEEAGFETTSESQNELKINTTNLIIFGFVDVAYERLLNEESSVGLSILFATDNNDENDFDYYRKFSATGFYRHFFSKKYAKGFFVEGFGMLHQATEDVYVSSNEVDGFGGRYEENEYTDFALGVSVGGKFVTRRGFIAEVYLGIGRNLGGQAIDVNVVGRGGISLGYRF
jgi:hypothetical protein